MSLSQKEVEAHLWGSAEVLRWKIDSSDYGLQAAPPLNPSRQDSSGWIGAPTKTSAGRLSIVSATSP